MAGPGQLDTVKTFAIENVRIWGDAVFGVSEPITVWVVNGRVAPEDENRDDSGIVRLQASGNVLIGSLTVGEIANFLVLDGNPMEDMTILADTGSHTLLLVKDGILPVFAKPISVMRTSPAEPGGAAVRRVETTTGDPTLDEEGRRMAIWDTGAWSGDVRGLLGMSSQRFDQDSASLGQVGDLGEYERAEVVAARLTLGGYVGRNYRVNYYIDYGYNGFEEGFKLKHDDEWSLYNLEFTIPKTRLGYLSFGRLKAPESISRAMAGQYLTMALRAVPISVLTASRDNGIRLTNSALDKRLTWGAGVYNDWLSRSGYGFSETNNYVTGRITGLPIFKGDGNHLLHLGLSARWTSMESESIRFRGKPGFFFGPDFIDTGDIEGDGAHWLIGELAWKKDNFMAMAETVRTSIDSQALGNPTFKGAYVWAEWTLTGESREYNRDKGAWNRPIPKGTFSSGGYGLWSLVASWSNTDLNDGKVNGGTLEEYTLGISWYPQKSFRWGLEVGRANLDRYGIRGKTTFAQFYLHVTNI
jgi:phosphate-selective porin OprO/OprP